MPFVAAFTVALLTALAVKHDVTDPGLRAMIAALVVFIPGVALTTAVLELTEGQMISGSSRLVWAATQLGLIAFGIVAGVSAGPRLRARVLQLRRAPRRLGALARRARLRRRRHGRPLDAARRLVLVARRSLRRVDRPVLGDALSAPIRAASSGLS